tara:strand:- start:6097 stop:7125 length:1029 start_codon:yes stop_codon:yes gene_type:complete
VNRYEVIAILSEHLRIEEDTKGKDNLAVYCPFHKDGKETSPSMYVYVGDTTDTKHTGMSFCHTCGDGWSLGSLLKKLGVSRKVIDVVKQSIDYAAPKKPTGLKSRTLFEYPRLPEQILGMFEFQPKALLKEGFDLETLKHFEVGFDRTRKRIIFPIRNHHGDLVGMSGRTTRNESPRYKVYRSELYGIIPNYSFNKSSVLWNLDKIYQRRMNIGSSQPVVVCEGFKAAMWVAQCGYADTVALLGTHMSMEQEFLLRRVANDVILFLDNDEPGRDAMRKIASRMGGSVRIANYKKLGASPDDLNEDEVRLAIENAQSITRMKYERRSRRKNRFARLSGDVEEA